MSNRLGLNGGVKVDPFQAGLFDSNDIETNNQRLLQKSVYAFALDPFAPITQAATDDG